MYIPPFCPNQDCKHHRQPQAQHWFLRNGYYANRHIGSIPRFRCIECGIGFSSQTFSSNYYAKKYLPFEYIVAQFSADVGIREIARRLQVSPTTIQRKLKHYDAMRVSPDDAYVGEIHQSSD